MKLTERQKVKIINVHYYNIDKKYVHLYIHIFIYIVYSIDYILYDILLISFIFWNCVLIKHNIMKENLTTWLIMSYECYD